MSNRPIGSILGATGGLVYVQVKAGDVPGSVVWRIVSAVAFIAIIYFVVVRGPRVEQPRPSRSGIRIYALCVVAMIVAIPVGAAILTRVLNQPQVVTPWVVFVVGAHFWTFASVFRLPLLRWLAVSMIVVAVIGAIVTLRLQSAEAAGWTGVAAGFVMLFFAAIGPQLSRKAALRRA